MQAPALSPELKFGPYTQLPYTKVQVAWCEYPPSSGRFICKASGDEDDITPLFFKIKQGSHLIVENRIWSKSGSNIFKDDKASKLPSLHLLPWYDLKSIVEKEKDLNTNSKNFFPAEHQALLDVRREGLLPNIRCDEKWAFIIMQSTIIMPRTAENLRYFNFYPIILCLKAPVSGEELDKCADKYAANGGYYIRFGQENLNLVVMKSAISILRIRYEVRQFANNNGPYIQWLGQNKEHVFVAKHSLRHMIEDMGGTTSIPFRAFIPAMDS